ncbi:MAG: NUDIX domain-containing protein [Deltaproteobacteria bacterium]|nr:MAG: NUDIX domain-containing protein [Deltaproteobacteria bacterium]
MKAFLIRDGRLLLVREAEGEQYWELPGGRIEVGEETSSPVAVLRRELREELGPSLEVEVERPILTWIRLPEPPRRTDFVFLVAFLCRHRRGEIVLSSEHVDFRWMTRSECDSVHLAPGYAAPLEQFWRTTSVSSP